MAKGESTTSGRKSGRANPSEMLAQKQLSKSGLITGTVKTVKFFSTTKGFELIALEEGSKDVFVHISAVERSGIPPLEEGQKVSFEVLADPRGPKRTKVVNVQQVSASETSAQQSSNEAEPDAVAMAEEILDKMIGDTKRAIERVEGSLEYIRSTRAKIREALKEMPGS